MSEEEQKLVHIEWRILALMGERKIRKLVQLQAELRKVGVEISSQQLGRIVDGFPERLNTHYLRGLLTVLGCDIGDLMRVHAADDPRFIESNTSVRVAPTLTSKSKRKPRHKKLAMPPSLRKQRDVLPPGFDGLTDDDVKDDE